jgi:hypothetical protein
MKPLLLRNLYALLLTFFCFTAGAEAQVVYDPADEMFNQQAEKDPSLIQKRNAFYKKMHEEMDRLQNLRVAQPSSSTSTPAFLIPVVVHVIHTNGFQPGTGDNISYAQIISQINQLNAGFAAQLPNSGTFTAYNTDIQFCLAQTPQGPHQWTDSNEPGVMRYAQNNMSLLEYDITNPQDISGLMALTHPSSTFFPFTSCLNIWVIPKLFFGTSTPLGFAPLPAYSNYPLDGIFMRSDVFGEDLTGSNGYPLDPQYNAGTILCHEVGHYLGLGHTCLPICLGDDDQNCLYTGDFICDTPPDIIADGSCDIQDNSCVENITPWGDRNDMVENFMDLSDDNCLSMFTHDQALLMQSVLNITRTELNTPLNHAITGINSPDGCYGNGQLIANFSISNQSPCAGSMVSVFSVQGSGNTAVSWQWTFAGGIPATANTSVAQVVFATPGIHAITLTVTDNQSNTVTYPSSIYVQDCTPIVSDQGHWYFGHYLGLDFSSGTAQADYAAAINSSMMANEAVSCVNDAQGNLLYYSNGMSLWDKNHQLVTSALWGTNSQSKTQIISVPNPGNPGQYILFHAPAQEDSPAPLYYSVVTDLGNTVAVSQLNTPIAMPPGITNMGEKITAIPHCNGRDYWIICNSSSNQFNNPAHVRTLCVYLVSPLGISSPNGQTTTPATYYVGLQNYILTDGVIKASPDGSQLALTCNNQIILLNFDNSTGMLSNQRSISTTYDIYALSYSPNSQNLYYALPFNTLQEGIMGVDVQPNSLLQPQVIVPTDLSQNGFMGMQLGPDNCIYVGRGYDLFGVLNYHIGKIPNPDVLASAGFIEHAVDFNPVLYPNIVRTNELPNFIDAHPVPAPPPVASVTQTGCNDITYSISGCIGNYQINWDFGDQQTSATATGTHTYSSPGTYTVTVTLMLGSLVDFSQSFTVNVPAPFTITGPATVCSNQSSALSYSVPVGLGTYNWTITGSATISGPVNQNGVSVNASGNFTLTCTVTYSANCQQQQTLNVQIAPAPVADAGNTSITTCPGGNAVLGGSPTASGGTGSYTYQWSPAAPLNNAVIANPTASTTVTTTFTVVVTDANNGCTATDQITCIIDPLAVPQITFSNVPGICNQSSPVNLSTYAFPAGGTFSGPGMSGNLFDPVAAGGTGNYTITYSYTNSSNCTGTGTFSVNVIPCCTVVTGVNTSDQQYSSAYGLNFGPVQPVRINGTFYIDNNFSILLHQNTNSIQLAPDARIVVKNGATLTIERSELKACSGIMWHGIVVEPLGTLNIINKSTVRDAKEAVRSINGAHYTIFDSQLIENYKNVIVDPFAGAHTGSMTATIITGTVLALPPYQGIRSRSAVEVTDVNSITFGDASLQTHINTLSYCEVGMLLTRSNVRITNAELRNFTMYTAQIAPACCAMSNCQNPSVCQLPTVGIAIWQDAGNLLMNNFNNGTYAAVNINNSTVGILTDNNADVDVTGNKFSAITNSNNSLITSAAIWIRTNNAGQLTIINNTFQNTTQGVYIRAVDFCTILVNNNKFDIFTTGVRVIQQNQCGIEITSNSFNTLSTLNTGTTAIQLQNSVATSQSDVTWIGLNSIFRCRTGIWLTSYPDAIINQSNSITFPSATPAVLSYGIRLQNCLNTTIDGNTVLKLGSNPVNDNTLRDRLYGITLETGCAGAKVTNNTLLRTGSGIVFSGSGNLSSTLTCNTLSYNMAGVRLINTAIGNQGSTFSLQNPNGIAHDNYWNYTASSGHTTIYTTGVASSVWYTRTGVSAVNPTTNPPASSMVPAGIVTMTGPYPQAPQLCIPDCNPNCNVARIAAVAQADYPFSLMSEPELEIHRQLAMHTLLQHPELLNMYPEYSATLNNFYNSRIQTASAQLSASAVEACRLHTPLAASMLNTITPVSHMDTNRKTVYDIFFRTWALHQYTFSAEDSATLFKIATEHVSTGGTAVYDARVMLDLDVTDLDNGSVWFGNSTLANYPAALLYPNPTTGIFTLEIELGKTDEGQVEVYSLTGQLISRTTLNGSNNKVSIDLSDKAEGVYLCRVVINNQHCQTHKIIRSN